jgi:periplasmic protein TonB
MKPEMILHADFLDILFINRNKSYGAYALRKGYRNRLTKAIAFTLSLVLLLGSAKMIYARFFDQPRLGNPVLVRDVKIDEVIFDKPKPKEQPKAIEHKQVAATANPTFDIVPDDQVHKPINENQDLDDKLIGLVDTPGDAYTGVPDPGPASAGTPGGTAVQQEPVQEQPMQPLHTADVMPEFPGGHEAFMKFMLRNLRQPDLEEGQKVVVKVQFVVDADGRINDVIVLQSGGELDREVIRVVNKMPNWKPGMQGGKFVPVYFQLPVTFVASE